MRSKNISISMHNMLILVSGFRALHLPCFNFLGHQLFCICKKDHRIVLSTWWRKKNHWKLMMNWILDVLWSFFQIQNKWKTRKLKEGRYEALNEISSMPCWYQLIYQNIKPWIHIRIPICFVWNQNYVLSSILQWIFIFIMQIKLFVIINSNKKQLGTHKVKVRKISSPKSSYLYQHVAIEN